ncbi:MAG: OmpA family protein [Candidatus Firestonebacteria bacterium]|nr:OmpA family protein [Candidatus Firestonebacteria bacterium]
MRRQGFRALLGGMLVLAGSLFFPGTPAWSYFFDYGAGVRPAGLGRAFVAVADDVNTINWNPAGLAYMRRYEITTMYASLFSGLQERLYTGQSDALSYNFVAASVPVDPTIGYFGASWSQFNSTIYHENTFNMAYARTVTYKSETVYVGSNVKVLNWNVPANDYTEALSKTGVTADLSLLYPLPRSFVAGICWENILPTDVGVTTYEEVPANLRLGLSWSQDLKPLKTPLDNILISTEWANRSYDQNTNTFRAGAESWFFQGLAGARVGVNSTEFTVGLSGRYAFPQLNMTQLELDYAFALPFYIEKSFGTHRISLTASWGQQAMSSKPTTTPVPEQKLEITPEENLAAQREKELALERAAEEAKLKEMMVKLQADIDKARAELDRVNELVKLGQTPAIQFQSGKAILVKNSFATLDKFGAVLEKHPSLKVRIEGHTDSQGKPKVNLRLSQTRVEAVKEYLRGRFNLTSDNLLPVGYGDTHPVASNQTAEGRAANRRVELKVLIPAGLEGTVESSGNTLAPMSTKTEPVKAEDIVRYEDLEKQKERVKVYEMQLNPEDVEDIFNQQHRQNIGVPAR